MSKTEKTESKESAPVTCGVVMPISAIEDCTAAHWAEVLTIIKEALAEANFEGSLVSYADESGIIQARIVQRLADDPIVVCDVSAKNPNVMFELGLRLAFDRPTVVIKDDKTNYSFDTSPIEHISYPRDLHYHKIQDFKRELASKVKASYEKGAQDPHYSVFLRHFVKITPKALPKEEVEFSKIVLDQLTVLRSDINSLRPSPSASSTQSETVEIIAEGESGDLNKFAESLKTKDWLPAGTVFVNRGGKSLLIRMLGIKRSQFVQMRELAKEHNCVL